MSSRRSTSRSLAEVRVSFTLPCRRNRRSRWCGGWPSEHLPANLDAREMKNQLKVFQDREWLADLPERRDQVDRELSAFQFRRSAADRAALAAGARPGVAVRLERGKADVLVQDEQSRMSGTVEGSDLSIETSLGKAVVPLGEVALFSGGAGVKRQMRIYLRNGEILVGRVEAKDLVLKAQAGVECQAAAGNVQFVVPARGRRGRQNGRRGPCDG